MIPSAAEDNYKLQQRIAAATTRGTRSIWRRMSDDFDASFSQAQDELVAIVEDGQRAAAGSADTYLEHVLFETAQPDLPVGHLAPQTLVGTDGDARSLDGLLRGAITSAKTAVGRGLNPTDALLQGGRWLDMAIKTALADANRSAVAAGIAMRPQIGGYTRMLNLPSCNRCVILAGKWFRWNEGFQRHPRCDCRHIPASEDVADDMTTDPYQAFASMSRAEQDAKFGRIEARAIRDGGDIYRVVNIGQRGLGSLKAGRVYGTPTRMTVDEIYRTAGTRSRAIAALQREGYITGPQTPGGNILGRYHEAYSTPISRPIVIGSKRDRVLQARDRGVREQLDRSTMTAAERRVYDAYVLRDKVARGENPFTAGKPLTDAQRQLAVDAFDVQVRALRGDPSRGVQPYPAQAQALARRLGVV